MNLITIDAHSRDMVANIVDSGCARADDFLWACQLRSYWDEALGDCRIKVRSCCVAVLLCCCARARRVVF